MLGEQIKRCREKRGFTQEQLAEKIGVSIETISSIERGINCLLYTSDAADEL